MNIKDGLKANKCINVLLICFFCFLSLSAQKPATKEITKNVDVSHPINKVGF